MDALLKWISIDPRLMVGKPVIRGTRITVESILQRIYGGMAADNILRDLPHIARNDIKVAPLHALE